MNIVQLFQTPYCRKPIITHPIYGFLKQIKEPRGMGTVHLGMMELERHGQGCPEQPPAVSAPYHKRIVEHTAVHPDSSVNVKSGKRGCPYDHIPIQVMIPACFCNLTGKPQIIRIELLQVLRKRNVA